MRKRIDTLMYDTETAKKLGEYDSDTPVNDFSHYHEELYKKRTGEYFLHGEGGPDSPYAQSAYKQDGFVGGEDIKPITFEEAKEWAQKTDNDELYKKEFDTIDDDEEKILTSLSLHKTAKRKLEQLAQKQGISQSDVVENMIMSE